MGVCNTPLQNTKKDEKIYLMGVSHTPDIDRSPKKQFCRGVSHTPDIDRSLKNNSVGAYRIRPILTAA